MAKIYQNALPIVFILAAVFFCSNAFAADELSVAEAVVCEDVQDRAPVAAGTSFPVTVGRLSCFTKIVGAQTPTEVTHVWYFGDTERARVNLSIGGMSWRTYSSKVLQDHEIGAWRVEVLGPTGEILKTVRFEVVK